VLTAKRVGLTWIGRAKGFDDFFAATEVCLKFKRDFAAEVVAVAALGTVVGHGCTKSAGGCYTDNTDFVSH
jgi:hypothetical protein